MSRIAAALFALLLAGGARQAPETLADHFRQVSGADAEDSPRVLFFRADVNGDGRRELLLAVSTLCGNGGCPWHVYARAGPRRVRYLGQADFHPHFFRVDVRRHALVSCWHVSAESCTLAEYRFAGGRMRRVELGPCRAEDAACQRSLAAIRTWNRRHGTPVLSAASDSLAAPGAWRAEGTVLARRPAALDYAVVAATPARRRR